MSTLIEDLTLLTPYPITGQHRAGRCLCGLVPGPEGLLIRVVSLALPPGLECILVDTATWRIRRVALDEGFDPLTVAPFEDCLHRAEGEWLSVCRDSVFF